MKGEEQLVRDLITQNFAHSAEIFSINPRSKSAKQNRHYQKNSKKYSNPNCKNMRDMDSINSNGEKNLKYKEHKNQIRCYI